jgi:hypothetical protein
MDRRRAPATIMPREIARFGDAAPTGAGYNFLRAAFEGERYMRTLLRFVLRETSPSRTRLSWWDLTELGLVAGGFLAYFLVRGAVVDRSAEALANARRIIDLQSSLGLWFEPQLQELTLQVSFLVRSMNFVYFWFDFPLIVGVGLILFWRRRRYYTLLRDSLLISGAFALVLYWTFPVAPPRYLTEWGFVDTLAAFDNLSYQAQSMKPFVNPYAAVPSLHVGWAALLAATIWSATSVRWMRAAGVTVFALQVAAVVLTGNHYLFDAVIGLLVCTAAWLLAQQLQLRGYPSIRGWLRRTEQGLARLETSRGAR